MRWARRSAAIVLFAGALYLCVRLPALHAEPVRLDYLLGAVEGVPLWQALLGAFLAGALASGILALLSITRARMLARRYRKSARSLEAELHELRSLPLAPGAREEDADEEIPETRERAALGRGV